MGVLYGDDKLFPDRSDRLAIRGMLEHLTPKRRVEWLKWCCNKVSVSGVTTYVENTDGSVAKVWSDAMTLVWGGRLSMREAGDRLHEMCRGRA